MRKQTLLVPVDFSEASKHAVKYAIILARKWNAKIIFVHGHAIGYTEYEGQIDTSMTYPPPGSLLSDQEISRRSLNYFLDAFPQLATVEHKDIVSAGLAVDVICSTAESEYVDLIIMGTTGASKLKAFFFGTNSEKVSRKAPCPVLVLPENLKSYEIETVCLALDTTEVENNVNWDLLVQLLKGFEAKLGIIHISENGDAAFKEREILAHYRNMLNGIKHSIHVFYDENPDQGISEFMEKNPIDLLVLLYREHGFFERLLHQGTRQNILYKTDIPLLILK
ncbi:universal stress protein [Arenibacter sp. BSSL-BM3]|uniref:Universal stress protein n=1 Tax=Arenibacter arenosicollis TaxID=2762274 RepID=A0ABR7QU23_9FLAO|nr:universal stress protein [Arenibacter arenosicollis]MBC8770584.1 universal stress protein [Arenibacter arenosicollis]